MTEKNKLNAEDLDWLRNINIQVNQAAKALEAAQGAQVFIHQNIARKYDLTPQDRVDVDTGEITRVNGTKKQAPAPLSAGKRGK